GVQAVEGEHRLYLQVMQEPPDVQPEGMHPGLRLGQDLDLQGLALAVVEARTVITHHAVLAGQEGDGITQRLAEGCDLDVIRLDETPFDLVDVSRSALYRTCQLRLRKPSCLPRQSEQVRVERRAHSNSPSAGSP